MDNPQERSFLFCTDSQSGKRKTVDAIAPKSVIGFMNATPWSGETRANRRANAMERTSRFLSILLNNKDNTPPCGSSLTLEQICGYASPDSINIEDKWTRIAKSNQLETQQQKFVEKYFLPLISSDENGVRRRLPVEQARHNMRITLVGFSYGGMFIAGIRKALIHQMEVLNYNKDEIHDIFSQIYQINFGVQRTENDQLEPRFSELNLVTRGDNQGIWESWVHQADKFIMLENSSEVVRDDGKKMTKPHSQEVYMQAIVANPELCHEISERILSDEISPSTFVNNSEQKSYIDTRLAEIAYRQQMLRRP